MHRRALGLPIQQNELEKGKRMLLADGLEAALVGVGRRCGQPDLAVYSIEKAIEVLMQDQGHSREDAVEWLEFNSIGAWVGDATPIWLEETTIAELSEKGDDG